MAKKLILIIAALFGASLLGLIFIFINKDLSGTSDIYIQPKLDKDLIPDTRTDVEPIKAGDISFSGSEGVVFHVPGKREFGYEKRISHPEGMFQILNPWVKLYSDNNIVRITAQRGLVPIDRESDALAGGGPEHGILEGDVSIEVFRKPENITFDKFEYEPKYKELAVKLGKTKFEREFSRIVGEGQIKVVSQQFLATGQDLVMQYDQINKKLQLLEISQMQKLIVTVKKGDKTKTPLTDTPSAQDQPAEPVQPTDFMTYNLNLSDNISVETENETFTADSLSIMADISSGQKIVEEKDKITSGNDNKQLIANNSIDRENYRIITMTCSGPLVITSPQEVYHAEDGLPRLEITASGKPVEIYRNGLLALKADKVIYSHNTNNHNHDIRMISKDRFSDLYLAQGIQQTITASNQISYDFNTDIATLAGPGIINSAINADEESKIEFKDTISIKFASSEDDNSGKINVPLNSNSKVEWIECLGTVRANIKEGTFTADKTRINFNTNTESNISSTTVPAIDNMIMNGNVTMTDSQSIFSCGKLILRFRVNEGVSEPCSLWAGENVKAENESYLIQATDHILINFGTPRSSAAKAQNAMAAQQSQTAFSDMNNIFDNLNPIYVIAEGDNNNVTFKNKDKNYAVKGSSIEGKLPDIATPESDLDPALAVSLSSNNLSEDGIWSIKGSPAFVQLSQDRTVSGSNITLDQSTGFCSIPGAGSLNLMAAGQLSGSASMPVNIKWHDGVVYNISNNILTLQNAVFEIDTLSQNSILQNSKLYASNVDIEIPPTTDNDTGKVKYDLKNFRAYGPEVKLVSNSIDLLNNDLLSQSQLHAKQLIFDNLPRPKITATGGGWLEHIILCSKDKKIPADEALAKIEQLENKSGSGTTDTGYYFLQFTKNMTLNVNEKDVLFDNPIAMHYLPIDPTTLEPVSLNEDNSLPAGGMRMYCNKLQIANSENDKAMAASRFAASSGNNKITSTIGNGALGYVAASGNIFIEQSDKDGLNHIFTAEELLFDTQQDKFSISGDETTPARYDQMQFSYLNYDLATSNYNGKTWGQSAINTSK